MTANGEPPAAPKHASTGLYVKAAPGLKLRDRKVTRLVRRMRGVMHWIEDSDLPACRAWAELEVLAGQVYAALRVLGVLNGKGEGRRLLDDYRKLRQTQTVLSRELGMTPAARMAIKASGTRAAFDLAAEMARPSETDADEITANAEDGETIETGD
jgi:hypothetical protein